MAHPLVRPGDQHLGLVAGSGLIPAGSTAHFQVSYDSSLDGDGKTLGDAVLLTCENDFTSLQGWFGGITPNGMPFTVNIVPGSGGASHDSCAAMVLTCDAFSGSDSDLVRMLVVAEVDEVFMAQQASGWDCGASNGEGLSRVLATELYPAALNGFASAAAWLNTNPRPDFVTNNDPTDQNYVSIGCAVLFINYLRSQLNFDLGKIVQTGGATLEDLYRSLTGRSDGFSAFSTLLAQRFPVGTQATLANDDPFPLPH